jgi:hypothetical protein
MISQEALGDKQAVAIAEAIATANEIAGTADVFRRPVRLLIEEETMDEGTPVWRINYLPVMPPGVFSRGGDYTVKINANDGTVHQTLIGQ